MAGRPLKDIAGGFVHISEASNVVLESAKILFHTKQKHVRKEAGRDSVISTDPALTETTYNGGS